MNIEKLGRLWQFVGVAIATHVATRHAMIWGHSEGEGDAGIPASWTRFLIGMAVAVVLIWTGVYIESRTRKRQREIPTPRT